MRKKKSYDRNDDLWRMAEGPEVWKPVVGYEAWNNVSNYGRVESRRWLKGTCKWTQYEVLTPTANAKGCHYVTLSNRCEPRVKFYVHRLVLLTFLPRDDSDNYEVNHKDANRANNYLHNLEWVTHQENIAHSAKMGLLPVGLENRHGRFTKEQLDDMRLRAERGERKMDIMAVHGISRSHLRDILLGKYRTRG